MKYFLMHSFLLALFSFSPLAMASENNCRQALRGLNEWEIFEKNQVISKYTFFEIDDWSRSTSFEQIAAVDAPKGSSIEILFQKNVSAPVSKKMTFLLKPLDQQKSATAPLEIDDTFDQFAGGFFILKLLSSGKMLCQETYPILHHEEDEQSP